MHFQLSADYTYSSSYNIGLGLTNPDWGNSAPPVWWYNNTVYGSQTGTYIGVYGTWWPDYHAGGQTLTSRLANNILYSASSVPYLDMQTWSGSTCTDSYSGCGTNSGNKNLMYGNGAATFPTIFTNTANVNPLFVTNGSDFHLQSGSPAIGAGLHSIADHTGGYSVTAPTYDIDGRVRPNPPSIGAYEFGSASLGGVQPAYRSCGNCPLNSVEKHAY